TPRRSRSAGSTAERTATVADGRPLWSVRSRRRTSLFEHRLRERTLDEIGDRLVDVRARIRELLRVDDRDDRAEHRHVRVAGGARCLEVHALVELALGDLEIDLRLIREDLRGLVRVVDDPFLRALVSLDDLLRRLRVLLQERLARIQKAVGVEVLVPVDEL